MKTKLEIASNWLPRYTGTSIDDFGDYILLTNFQNYVASFAEQFGCDVKGEGRPIRRFPPYPPLNSINSFPINWSIFNWNIVPV